jgi:hypothetical protein
VKRIPNRGAFVHVDTKSVECIVVGYDLVRHETAVVGSADQAHMDKVQEFLQQVASTQTPKPLGRDWELYGLPSGPVDEKTRWLYAELWGP